MFLCEGIWLSTESNSLSTACLVVEEHPIKRAAEGCLAVKAVEHDAHENYSEPSDTKTKRQSYTLLNYIEE